MRSLPVSSFLPSHLTLQNLGLLTAYFANTFPPNSVGWHKHFSYAYIRVYLKQFTAFFVTETQRSKPAVSWQQCHPIIWQAPYKIHHTRFTLHTSSAIIWYNKNTWYHMMHSTVHCLKADGVSLPTVFPSLGIDIYIIKGRMKTLTNSRLWKTMFKKKKGSAVHHLEEGRGGIPPQ